MTIELLTFRDLSQPQTRSLCQKTLDLEQKISELVCKALVDLTSEPEACQKEFGLSLEEVISFFSPKIVDFCLNERGTIYLGKMAQAGWNGAIKKKWKCVVIIDKDRKIAELLIGRLQGSGTYSNFHQTFDGNVILVSKKKKTGSVEQIEKASSHTFNLHEAFQRFEESSKEVQELIQYFEIKESVSKYKKKLIQFLPPITKVMYTGLRALTIDPMAIPVSKICRNAPKSKEEIAQRIKIFRDIAIVIAFCHIVGFIHSDLKPENMLVYKGMARIHDVGGAFVIPDEISIDKIKREIINVVITGEYSHHQDDLALKHFIKNEPADSVKKIIEVLLARDVFSLGVSIVEVLNGLYHLDGSINAAFLPGAYVQIEGSTVLNGLSSSRKPVNCIREIIGDESIDLKLQMLLDQALNHHYKDRCSARVLAKGLIEIYDKLV